MTAPMLVDKLELLARSHPKAAVKLLRTAEKLERACRHVDGEKTNWTAFVDAYQEAKAAVRDVEMRSSP